MKSFASLLIFLTCISCIKNPNNTYKKKGEISDGYSQQKSDNYTGSASEIKDFQNNITLDNYLRKVPGVSVQGDGASAVIKIRGVSTVNGGQEPLYILNGTTFSGGFSVLYQTIHPSDIQTVSVLKDASSTGIYGSRGANGVIVISLKIK